MWKSPCIDSLFCSPFSTVLRRSGRFNFQSLEGVQNHSYWLIVYEFPLATADNSAPGAPSWHGRPASRCSWMDSFSSRKFTNFLLLVKAMLSFDTDIFLVPSKPFSGKQLPLYPFTVLNNESPQC